MAENAEKAPGPARIAVFAGRFDVVEPFDAQAYKGAGRAVQDEIAGAFGRSERFEVVSSSPEETGFDIPGVAQKPYHDGTKGAISDKVPVVLAETPGRAMFGNLSKDGGIDGVRPGRIERSVEELAVALAGTAGASAARRCERRAET